MWLLQFAFLTFLLGHSLEAFGQWKALLHLLLACEEAPLRTRTPLYVCSLATIRAQLQHCLSSGRCANSLLYSNWPEKKSVLMVPVFSPETPIQM